MSRRMILGVALAFGVATAAVIALGTALDHGTTSAPPKEAPSHFVSRTVATIGRDDYATAWSSLYPAHQAVAPREDYVACEMKTPLGWRIRSIRVVRVVDRKVHVPGDSEDVAAKAVTLRLRVRQPAFGSEEAFSHTFTAVAIGDRWSWILTPGQYERYSTHSCGT